jgi:hypothetical protein
MNFMCATDFLSQGEGSSTTEGQQTQRVRTAEENDAR